MFRSAAIVALSILASMMASLVAVGGVIPLSSFTGGAALIDFGSIAPGESLHNQFAALGVTFDAGLFGDPFPGTTIQGGSEVTNFTSVANITNPIVARFSPPQRRVGLLVAGVPPYDIDIRVAAYRKSELVGEGVFRADTVLPSGTLPSSFAGLQSFRGIDRIEISNPTGIGGFSLDDLRFESAIAIPSPAAALLAWVALAAISACRPTRRCRNGLVGVAEALAND